MSIDHAPSSTAEHRKETTLDEARRIVKGYYPHPYRPNGEPITRDIVDTDSKEQRVVVVGTKPIPLNRIDELPKEAGITGEMLQYAAEMLAMGGRGKVPILLVGESEFYDARTGTLMVAEILLVEDSENPWRIQTYQVSLTQVEQNRSQFAILPAVHVELE